MSDPNLVRWRLNAVANPVGVAVTIRRRLTLSLLQGPRSRRRCRSRAVWVAPAIGVATAWFVPRRAAGVFKRGTRSRESTCGRVANDPSDLVGTGNAFCPRPADASRVAQIRARGSSSCDWQLSAQKGRSTTRLDGANDRQPIVAITCTTSLIAAVWLLTRTCSAKSWRSTQRGILFGMHR